MSDAAVDRRFGLGDVDDLGHAVDAIAHDAFDATLEGLGRHRARAAGADETDRDDTGRLVDIDEFDVALVGLERGPDDFDARFDLGSHDAAHSISQCRTILTMSLVAALIAHQGGWDEVLLVGGPIIAIIALLGLAKRRVDRAQSDQP